MFIWSWFSNIIQFLPCIHHLISQQFYLISPMTQWNENTQLMKWQTRVLSLTLLKILGDQVTTISELWKRLKIKNTAQQKLVMSCERVVICWCHSKKGFYTLINNYWLVYSSSIWVVIFDHATNIAVTKFWSLCFQLNIIVFVEVPSLFCKTLCNNFI